MQSRRAQLEQDGFRIAECANETCPAVKVDQQGIVHITSTERAGVAKLTQEEAQKLIELLADEIS